MQKTKRIPDVEAVRGGEVAKGDLYLTDHHIVMVIHQVPPEGAEAPKPRELYIAYPIIAHCSLRPTPPSSGRPSSIRLRGRDFMFISFHFTNNTLARETFEHMRARTCRLRTIEELYAFSYQSIKLEKPVNGWALYNPKAEFRRQGISTKSTDRGWRVSHINKDYSFSPTYPAFLVVPSNITDATIKHAGPFRSRSRIPALTYLHSLNNCSITRSSQPMVGLRSNRSVQDEALVGACFSASATVEFNGLPEMSEPETSPATSQTDLQSESTVDVGYPDMQEEGLLTTSADAPYGTKTGKRMVFGAQQSNLIVDARPSINAFAMQAVGKGSERMDLYPFATKAYLNIPNIHVMRDSLNTVVEAIKDGDISRLPPNRELLVKSDWLRHITGILDGSALIARQVGIRHSHVLIHCSDGWDRTSQLSALSQIMLDPYYRTINGFIVLVEKDWLSFGHMFQQRSGPLNHEKWFTVERDGMAGTSIQPGDSEGRAGEAIDNALATAKRLFRRENNVNVDSDEQSPPEEPPQPRRPVEASEATRPNEISPVFHQFLDATYQILRQHPTRFEFNERFLRRLLYHLYAAQYGTFLWNSEKARHDAKAHERTKSVWDYFLSRKQDFINKQYDPTINDYQSGHERLVFPKLDQVRWWASCFGRSESEMNEYLDIEAARGEKIEAYASASPSPGPASRSRSPVPSKDLPDIPTGNTVLAGVETAHETLTPARSGNAMSLTSSPSAETASTFSSNLARLRDGVSGLDLGRGAFVGGYDGAASTSAEAVNGHGAMGQNGEQEMDDMPVANTTVSGDTAITDKQSRVES